MSTLLRYSRTAVLLCAFVGLSAHAYATPAPARDDFDGDGKSDLVVYKPVDGIWMVQTSSSGYTATTIRIWGDPGATAVPGDYDGDGKYDYATYVAATGQWSVLLSGAGYTTSLSVNCGGEGYEPAPGDYDGDGKTDPAVYRPATGGWFALKSSTNYTTSISIAWGGYTFNAIPGFDFDGDGKADPAVYRVTTQMWKVLLSGSGYTTTLSWILGSTSAVLVPGDYDGDGKADPAFYQKSTALWTYLKSGSGYASASKSSPVLGGVVPVPLDVDGDHKIDVTVFRSGVATWYALTSTTNYTTLLSILFGALNDTPVTTTRLTPGDDIRVAIESPTPGASVTEPFTLSGWALAYTPGAVNTGIDQVKIQAYANAGSGTMTDLGTATLGGPSPATAPYGTQYANSGFSMSVGTLAAGTYRFSVTAHVASTGVWTAPQTVTVPVLRPAATPTISPNPGTYTPNAPKITLHTDTVGADIYYTLDGTQPQPPPNGGTSAQYTAEFDLPRSAQVRAIAVGGGYSLSAVASASYELVVGAPTMMPGPETAPGPINVTLTSATTSATFTWTDDGTDPAISPTASSAPVVIAAGTTKTIKARASKSGWTQSAMTSGTYTAQAVPPPTIERYVTPGWNAAGWNHTNVTVTFRCTGMVTCLDPVTIATEGAGQQKVWEVTDPLGRSATTSVTLNIDKTPPSLTFATVPPSETDATSLTITTAVSDTGSGLAGVTCNGQTASMSNGQASCTPLLHPGLNVILLQALDVAGNRASLSAAIQRGTASGPAPTELRVAPTRVTLPLGSARALSLTDEFFRVVDTATWTTSDATIATVSTDGLVTGIAGGTATVTATLGSLTASVAVTVLTGTTLSAGTEQWTVDASPGYSVLQMVRGMPGMNGTTYLLETPLVDGSAPQQIRVLDDDGQELWRAAVPIASNESANIAMGDALGGVLLHVSSMSNGSFGLAGTLRMGEGGTGAWRAEGVGAMGQAGTGTVYAREHLTDAEWVVVLDGETGAERGRVEGARWKSDDYNQDFEAHSTGTGGFGKLVVDKDGNARVLVTSRSSYRDTRATTNPWVYIWTSRLELWTISPTGSVTTTTLSASSGQTFGRTETDYASGASLLLPDNDGTVLVMWTESWADASSVFHYDNRFARVSLGGAATTFSLATESGPLSVNGTVLGEGNTLFVSTGSDVLARDASDGSLKWTVPGTTIVASTAGGGITIQNGDEEQDLDSLGNVVSTRQVPQGGLATGIDARLSNSFTSIASIVAAPVPYADAGYTVPGGSALQGQAAPHCQPPVYDGFVGKAPIPLDYSYFNTGGPLSSQARSYVAQAAYTWTQTPGHVPYPHIAEGTSSSHNVEIRWWKFPPRNPSEIMVRQEDHTLGHAEFPLTPKADWDWVFTAGVNIRKDREKSPTNPAHFGMQLSDQYSVAGALDIPLFQSQFATTTLHEFGHLMGLDHAPTGCLPSDTVMLRSNNDRTTPSEKDWNAVNARVNRRKY